MHNNYDIIRLLTYMSLVIVSQRFRLNDNGSRFFFRFYVDMLCQLCSENTLFAGKGAAFFLGSTCCLYAFVLVL